MNAHHPRVCLLTNSFYPRIGGGETHALLLCREWLRRGVRVFVLTRRTTADLKEHENLDGLDIHRLPPAGFRRFGKYLMIVPTYRELIRRRHEYDVLYVCGLRVAGIPAMLACHKLNKPCVLRTESRGELSGDFIWQSPDKAIRNTALKPVVRLYLRWRNRILSRAPAFVAISQETRTEFLSQNVPEAKVHLIYNGIDTSRFQPADAGQRRRRRQELGLPDTATFMYSGKLNRGKGLEMLLRAWKDLSARRRDCHLVLVGGGDGQFLSCEHELRTFVAQSRIQDRVTFTGFQTEMCKYLQTADYFVFPSENEALGISLIEALACELPAIAADAGGIPEVVTDGVNGRLAPIRDSRAWLAHMEAFLRDPARAQDLGRRGRETVNARFSIGHVADQHLDLFRSLVATPH